MRIRSRALQPGEQRGNNDPRYSGMCSSFLSAVLTATRHAGVSMYLDFYRLKSAPFQITPDPTFLFLSASHQAALDVMAAGITTRQGLVTITGARGVGKTTLVQAYLARVAPPQLTTIVLWHAHLSFLELLALLTRHFAVQGAMDNAEAMLARLQQRLWHES